MSSRKLRKLFLEKLSDEQIERLKRDWPVWARLKQRPPLKDWRTWLILGGRGAGKTRTGAEWIKGIATADLHFAGDAAGRIALVGETFDDARDVMVEGESGLLAIHGDEERPTWLPSRRELSWPNGTIAKLFSSADPDGIRGNQFGAAWCDELGKWKYPDATWNMLQFSLRLGTRPRQVVTTTPKPLKLLKRLLEDSNTITVRSTTSENAENLASGFVEYVTGVYGNTAIGRQELEGEIIEDNEGSLWNRKLIDATRVKTTPAMRRIVVAVDPPASSQTSSDSCGIVAAGCGEDGDVYVLKDGTLAQASPNLWANRVLEIYHELKADLIVAEINQGGEMVEQVLRSLDPTAPIRSVHASRGKWLRAQPVAMLYEQGFVHHLGGYDELEDQMCALGPDGMANGTSPDRLDALVWALTELKLTNRPEPRVRGV